MMVWDASGSVSSVYSAICTTTQIPKDVLTQLTWSATDLVSAREMEMRAQPLQLKGDCSEGQVVLVQALSKGYASSYSEWISALEIKLTERGCTSFLPYLTLGTVQIFTASLTILFNYQEGGYNYRRADQPRKALCHPEKPTCSEKGQEQFHFSTITIWHDLYHTLTVCPGFSWDIFFLVAGVVLWLEFIMRIMLITH